MQGVKKDEFACLSVRARKGLRFLGIQSRATLLTKASKDLLRAPNFGQAALAEIAEKLDLPHLARKRPSHEGINKIAAKWHAGEITGDEAMELLTGRRAPSERTRGEQ